MATKLRLNLHLSPAQRQHLEAVAARYGIALTDAARRIIDADAERERRWARDGGHGADETIRDSRVIQREGGKTT